MKKLVILVYLLSLSILSAQHEYLKSDVVYDSLERSYSDFLKTKLNKYYIKDSGSDTPSMAIQPKLLDENLNTAFNTVVFGSSGLLSNSSSFGYSQNKDKTNVSINLISKPKKWQQTYLTFGGTIEGSGTLFDFYSNNEWENKVTANAGIVFKIKGSSFFTPNEKGKRFEDLKKSRKFWVQKSSEEWAKIKEKREDLSNHRDDLVQELLHDLRALIDQGKTNSDEFKNKHNIIDKLQSTQSKDWDDSRTIIVDNIFDDLMSGTDVTKKQKANDLIDYFPKVQKLVKEEKISDAYTTMIQEVYQLDSLVDDSMQQKFIDNKLYEFDKENDITYGYSFQWISFTVGAGNSTYNFTESNISEELLPRFQADFPNSYEVNKVSITALLSYNWNMNTKNSIFFLQGGLSTQSGSFLDSQLVDGDIKLGENDQGEFIVLDDRERELPNGLGSFDQIEETLHTGSSFIYGAFFTGTKKNIGLNASLKFTTNLSNIPEGIYFEDNYTFLFGPIFRTIKDDNTSLSFGIDIGWENAPINNRASEDFVGRVRLGVPFGIFKKKKEEKKS